MAVDVRPSHLVAVGVPDRRVLLPHPDRELRCLTGAVGAHDGNDRQRRQSQPGVLALQLGVVPHRDGTREDLRDRVTRQAEVGDALAADLEVIHERRAPGDDRHVRERPVRKVLDLVRVGDPIGDVGAAELRLPGREIVAPRGGSGAGVVDHPAEVAVDVADPLRDHVARPRRARALDRHVGAPRGVRRRRELEPPSHHQQHAQHGHGGPRRPAARCDGYGAHDRPPSDVCVRGFAVASPARTGGV